MTRDPAQPELSTVAKVLVAHLHRRARGAGQAKTYAELAATLAGLGCRVVQRDIYDLVAELQLAGRSVGSTPRRGQPGAFICVTDADWDAAEANLRTRIVRPLRRLRRLRRTRREIASGQRPLDLVDPDPPPGGGGAAQGRSPAPGPARKPGVRLRQRELFAEEGSPVGRHPAVGRRPAPWLRAP